MSNDLRFKEEMESEISQIISGIFKCFRQIYAFLNCSDFFSLSYIWHVVVELYLLKLFKFQDFLKI